METERLVLRKMTSDDFGALYEVLADSDIMKHYPYTFDEKGVRNRINKTLNDTGFRDSDSGRYVLRIREK